MYLGFANYRDGTGRVVQHDVRYRAEAHAIEAATATRTDDKQLRTGCRFEQRGPRRASRHPSQHRELGIFLLVRPHRAIEVRFHAPRIAQAGRRVRECAHREHRNTAQLRLPERDPGIRVLRPSVRVVLTYRGTPVGVRLD